VAESDDFVSALLVLVQQGTQSAFYGFNSVINLVAHSFAQLPEETLHGI